MSFLDDHGGDCGCCGWDAMQAELERLSLARIERRAYDWMGLRRVLREETNDAPYIEGEAAMTGDLADHAADVADAAEEPILSALAVGYISEGAITTALGKAASIWQNKAWEKKLENDVRETLNSLALIGQHDIPFGPELDATTRLRIVDGMAASAKYYTNGYFNNQVMPAVSDAVHAAVLGGRAHDGGELQAIHKLLDARLRSVPYWNLVANGAASRAYHYGYLKTGIAKGLTTVEYHATIDDKTSRQCFHLNGTQWHAADVSLLADRIAAAQGDAIKTVAPWVVASQVIGKTSAELLAMGCVIPPIHGRCRSKLIFV